MLKHIKTLVYFDAPQLIVAVDRIGTRYLCLLSEQLEDQDKFLCVPVSESRLKEFEEGELDLLRIYESPELEGLYTGDFELFAEESFLAVEPIEQVPENWYPEEGFLLTPLEGEDKATSEAKERNKAIVHLALDPPESREGLTIEVQHLVNGLRIYQRLLKHAYNKSIRGLARSTRELLADESNYQMEVFSFSQGSFTINMQSKTSADMLGYVNTEKALGFVDAAVSASSDPELATQFLSENRGHFLNAYRALLKFIVENDAPLKYEWSLPEYAVGKRNVISVESATELYEILTVQESLTAEIVTLVGTVAAVSTINNSWTFLSEEDDRSYSGKVAPESSVKLNGITVLAQRYRFHCEERLHEVASTGEETTELLLLSYESL